MYVCICHGITDRRLKEALRDGARSFEELQARTGVASCCGACEGTAREIVQEASSSHVEASEPA